ncbi:hypothetical protein AJ80_09872 [Polytolypa hystricis UAMH7299]|uniref:Uncharacterized protein n=1 Tax=Polytolypa hystricis (strain UAMH7299) TaxID=1447883 RepID=A0A2B7WHQ1_POLH7|nr:hypothetical protein AJ80_09872 [Polytolypa hystricis UAMH7299]
MSQTPAHVQDSNVPEELLEIPNQENEHETIEIFEEEESHHKELTPLTQALTNPITSCKFEYTEDLIEYPKTHEFGYTYVVHTGTLAAEEVKMLMHDIQYSKAQCHPPKQIYCSFLQTPIRGMIELVETDIRKQNALSLACSIKLQFEKGLSCHQFMPTCKPKFGRHTNPDVTGHHAPYIACINSTPQDYAGHFFQSPQGITQLDILFLERIYEEEMLQPLEKCGIIDQMKSTRKYCGFDHPNGPGKMMKLASGFLKSPALHEFYQTYQAQSLPEIHQSFSNMDRFHAILYKQQLVAYPASQDYNGVQFEMH